MYRLKWFAATVGVPFLLIFGATVLKPHLLEPGYLNPSQGSRSSFMQTYTPDETIAAFDEREGSWRSASRGGNAGRGFVTYASQMRVGFTIKPERKGAFPKALSEDLAKQLLRSGATFTSSEIPQKGRFFFRYVCGHTQGTVAVEPLEDDTGYQGPTYKSKERVMAQVNIQEKWFKSVPDMPH